MSDSTLDRKILTEFSKKALEILKPDGTNAILQDLDQTLREAKSIRKDVKSMMQRSEDADERGHSVAEVRDILDNVTSGKFASLLNPKFDLLLPDMKVDSSAIDKEKSLEFFAAKIAQINADCEKWSKSQVVDVVDNPSISESIQPELAAYGEAMKRFQARLSDVEISERLNMAERRDKEMEKRLKTLTGIVGGIGEFVQAKSDLLKSGEDITIRDPVKVTSPEYAGLVEKLLADSESVTYSLTDAISS